MHNFLNIPYPHAVQDRVTTLAECPPGLFWSNGSGGWALGFRSEYSSTEKGPEAYVLLSGEYFWGGAKTHAERRELTVHPISLSAELPVQAPSGVAMLRQVLDRKEQERLTDEAKKKYFETVQKPRLIKTFAPILEFWNLIKDIEGRNVHKDQAWLPMSRLLQHHWWHHPIEYRIEFYTYMGDSGYSLEASPDGRIKRVPPPSYGKPDEFISVEEALEWLVNWFLSNQPRPADIERILNPFLTHHE